MYEEEIQRIRQEAQGILKWHGASLGTGFLPAQVLRWLPTESHMNWHDPYHWQDSHFLTLDSILYNLPELIREKKIKETIGRLLLPQNWPPEKLHYHNPVTWRLMLAYAMLTHAYFHETLGYKTASELMRDENEKNLPPQLAVPLWTLSRITGVAPTMSYFLYAPCNYGLKDPHGKHTFDNIEVLHTFSGTKDEKWFIKIHQGVDIILRDVIEGLMSATIGASQDPPAEPNIIIPFLEQARDASERAVNLLERMREYCESKTYFDRVRLFYMFPKHVIYEGVEELAGKPQEFFGETGGQDPGMHFRLLALGIDHSSDPYFDYMRAHMPKRIRDLFGGFTVPHLRNYVLAHTSNAALVRRYNACVQTIVDWRLEHRSLVREYIGDYGDGHGTGKPPLKQLDDLIETTRAHLIT